LLPELLPFICQTDQFFEYAVGTSAGSLSPRTNWKNLREFDIVMPPLEKQLRIKELMISVENTLVHYQKSSFLARKLFKSILENLLDPVQQGWKAKQVGDSFQVSCGGTPKRDKPEYWNGEIPWIKTGEVNFNSIKSTEEHITQAGLENSSAKLAPINSVIMALFGQGPTLGRVAILDIEATTNQACAIIHPEEGYNMRFVYYSLWRQYERVRAKARGASQPNINASIVKSLEIPYISIEEQNSWVDKLDDQLSAMRSIDERIECTAHLKKRILNKLFG
jgi:type I restriction enzyme S subunit